MAATKKKSRFSLKVVSAWFLGSKRPAKLGGGRLEADPSKATSGKSNDTSKCSSDDSILNCSSDISVSSCEFSDDESMSLSALTSPSKSKKEMDKKAHDCWYFSSGHVLINRERVKQGLKPLRRDRVLDEMAGFHAEAMADELRVFQSVDTVEALRDDLDSYHVGQNVQVGDDIRSMIHSIISRKCPNRTNMYATVFDEFGLATHKGEDGRLYMVQMFRKRRSLKSV